MSIINHSKNLEYIKKITGASFVGFQNFKDIYHLRFIKDGRESFYKLEGTPLDMDSSSYKNLLDLIIYGSSKDEV